MRTKVLCDRYLANPSPENFRAIQARYLNPEADPVWTRRYIESTIGMVLVPGVTSTVMTSATKPMAKEEHVSSKPAKPKGERKPHPMKGKSRLGLTPEQQKKRDAIFAKTGGGEEYRKQCKAAGIPVTEKKRTGAVIVDKVSV
jgi:hypothetical protein